MTEERRICLVCGRVLDYWQTRGWQHSIATTDPEEVDHPPIPVTAQEAGEQLRPRCDFCYSDYPEFILPARTFREGGPGVSVGDWAACEMCARCIEKDAWNKLMERVVASWEARQGPMSPQVAADLRRMYRTLRKNVTGSIRREKDQP